MIDYLYCVFTIVCFMVGFILGQRNNEGKKLIDTKQIMDIPKKVTEKAEKNKEKKEVKKEIKLMEQIVQNIENYDGSNNNQKEIKR